MLKLIFLVLISIIFLGSCSLFPQFDESGKSSTPRCLYLRTDPLKVKYECREGQKIKSIYLSFYGSSGEKPVIYDLKFDPAVTEFALPFKKDTLCNKAFSIGIGITNAHWRERFFHRC